MQMMAAMFDATDIGSINGVRVEECCHDRILSLKSTAAQEQDACKTRFFLVSFSASILHVDHDLSML